MIHRDFTIFTEITFFLCITMLCIICDDDYTYSVTHIFHALVFYCKPAATELLWHDTHHCKDAA